MLSNIEIEEYCKKHRFPLVEVISKDELQNQYPKVGSYYINMEDSDKGNGTHWVMFKILPPPFNRALYFDSFGTFAPKDIDEFLHHYKPYVRNDRQIQNLNSEYCGYFCLATDKYFTDHYDKSMDLEENFNKYLSLYSDNTKTNDKIVKQYLAKTI